MGRILTANELDNQELLIVNLVSTTNKPIQIPRCNLKENELQGSGANRPKWEFGRLIEAAAEHVSQDMRLQLHYLPARSSECLLYWASQQSDKAACYIFRTTSIKTLTNHL